MTPSPEKIFLPTQKIAMILPKIQMMILIRILQILKTKIKMLHLIQKKKNKVENKVFRMILVHRILFSQVKINLIKIKAVIKVMMTM